MPNISRKAIGRRIAEQRRLLELTQAELAEKCSLDPVYLSQLETGKRLMSLEALLRICHALRVEPGLILGSGEENKQDALIREIRELVSNWSPRQQRAVLRALRALSEL